MSNRRRFSLNLDKMKERVEESQSYSDGGDSSDFRGFATGDNFIRILPPWSEAGDPFKEVHNWWLPPPIKGVSYNFAKMGLLGECPIQVAVDEAARQLGDSHPFLNREENGAACRRSYLANALLYRMELDADNKPVGAGVGGVAGLVLERERPFILRVSYTVAMAVYSMIGDPALQPPVVDPEQGRILRVRKPKSFEGKNNYEVLPLGVPHPFGSEAQMDKIWDSLHDLDKLVRPTEKMLQRAQSHADKIYVEVLKQVPTRKTVSLGTKDEVGATHDTVEQPPASSPAPATAKENPAPETAAAKAETPEGGGNYGIPKPDCYLHHPPSDKCPEGGLEPHKPEHTCGLCPWEYHCERDSATAKAEAAG